MWNLAEICKNLSQNLANLHELAAAPDPMGALVAFNLAAALDKNLQQSIAHSLRGGVELGPKKWPKNEQKSECIFIQKNSDI